MDFNVLSLFDGMSCGQLALNKKNIKYDNYFASEIDNHAIKATQFNYPNTIQLGDVTKINSKDLPIISLLLGGSPCQGFSFMGKQLNFDDPRSKLFFEYVRLLKELKPKYFLLENVKMKKEYEKVISENLGCEPIKINSSLVSGQLRSRFYWTNIPNVTIPEDKNIQFNDILEYGKSERKKSVTLLTTYCEGRSSPACVKHYLSKHVNQIVPDEKSLTGYRILSVKEASRLQTVPDDYLIKVPGVSNNAKYKMLGNGWTVDVISHILSFIPKQ